MMPGCPALRAQPSGETFTFLYKNKMAENARFCVEAKQDGRKRKILRGGRYIAFYRQMRRKTSISDAPICAGCRFPWNRMKRLIQCT